MPATRDMPAADFVVDAEFRVRYAETDAMGVVYHSNYLVWFEVGRGEYLLQQGMGHDEWEALGVAFPVTEAYARYARPARYGDLVRVRTWVAEVHSRLMTFAYRVEMADDGTLLTTGWTRHACVDSTGRPCRIPPEIRSLLHPSAGPAGSD